MGNTRWDALGLFFPHSTQCSGSQPATEKGCRGNEESIRVTRALLASCCLASCCPWAVTAFN